MAKSKSKSKTHTELIRKFEERHEKGCVIRCGKKGHNHRKNGYNYAKANYKSYYNRDFTTADEKKRLNKTDVLGATIFGHRSSTHRDPRYTKDAWHLEKGSNYQVGKWPFTNQAHHIIPVGAFHRIFDLNESLWIQQCEYNINAGNNIIILPTEERVGKAMLMLIHPTNHHQYNIAIKKELDKIKRLFSEAKDDEEDGHYPLEEEDMPKVKDELEQFSIDTMFDIFQAGRKTRRGKTGAGSPMNALSKIMSVR